MASPFNQRYINPPRFTRRVADFETEGEPFGDGTYAKVYRARLSETAYSKPKWKDIGNKIVILKEMAIPDESDEYMRTKVCVQITNEELAKKHFNHPSLVRIYGSFMGLKEIRTRAGETKKQMYHYLVFEYMDQGDLFYTMNIARLNEKSCVRVATNVLSGVMEMSRIGYLHADVKPENIFVDKMGNVKLGDFGSIFNKVTNDWFLDGSFQYLAPEIIRSLLIEYSKDDREKKRLSAMPLSYGDEKTVVFSLGISILKGLYGDELYREFRNFDGKYSTLKAQYDEMMEDNLTQRIDSLDNLEKKGKAWLKGALNLNPAHRMSLKEAITHTWLQSSTEKLKMPKKELPKSASSFQRITKTPGSQPLATWRSKSMDLTDHKPRSVIDNHRASGTSQTTSRPGTAHSVTTKRSPPFLDTPKKGHVDVAKRTPLDAGKRRGSLTSNNSTSSRASVRPVS